jgi:hypothetical protein
MSFELKITANSLEELWNTLSTFKSPNFPQSPAPPATAPDTNPRVSSSTADTADTNGVTPKRGPGRPPGSTNKPKPTSPPPAFLNTIKAEPNGADEPEPEETGVEDAGQAPVAAEVNEDDERAAITAELGRYWKKSPALKTRIQNFRSEVGIATMMDLRAEDFGKARALIAELEATAP